MSNTITNSGLEYASIKIGRNDADNTQLVHNANPEHYWFHLANGPSCHVILETNEPTTQVIVNAATSVVSKSKTPPGKKVSVNYLMVKYVKLTKIPGKVILKKNPKTIWLSKPY